MNNGYFKAIRGEIGENLIKRSHHAYILLSIIAYRARRTPDLINKLGIGEAILGDYENYNMTRQEYRTAIEILKECNLATFRTTTKGSIATIINTDVFDINIILDNQPTNHRTTIEQPSNNHRTTTNKKERSKEVKNDKNVFKEEKKISYGDFVRLTEREYQKLCEKFTKQIADDWIERMNEYAIQKSRKFKEYTSHYMTILHWDRLKQERETKQESKREHIPVMTKEGLV